MSTVPIPDCKPANLDEKLLFSFTGNGVTSRQPVKVDVYEGKPKSGINFILQKKDGSSTQEIIVPARADFVVNTVRNVVLGTKDIRLCFVEHILAAAALWGMEDLLIYVDGPEVPLEDGSAAFWLKLFEKSSLPRKFLKPTYELKETIIVSQGDKQVIAYPAEQFSITYLMNWHHPAIGKRWATWNPQEQIEAIALARTFGPQSEQELLGLSDNFVSITKDGFSKPLHFEDEPVRHKLLDLLGDLTLCGVNPLAIKAHFVSIKAGHELDVKMASRLQTSLKQI